MERPRVGVKDKISSLLFRGKEPREYSIIFHIPSGKPPQVNQHLVSEEDIRGIDQALSLAGICPSLEALNKRNKRSYSNGVEATVFSRVARFVDNYVKAQVFEHQQGYQPAAVAAGRSGIYNALTAAEVLSLEAAVGLVARESRLVAIARGSFGEDSFRDPDLPLGTSLMEHYAEEFNNGLTEVTLQDPKIAVIGGRGGRIATLEEMRQEIARQFIIPGDRMALEQALRRCCPSKPHEIGLDHVDRNKYLTAGGVAVVLGAAVVLTVIAHNRRQKS